MGETKVKTKKKMGEQTVKIVRTMIITAIVLGIVAGFIIYSVVNSSETLILGTWEATNDGYTVTVEFTDEYENKSTKETLYYITEKSPDGKEEKEKGTYNISNEKVMTLRPANENVKDSATVEFTIEGKTLNCKYTRDFEEKSFTLEKVAEYAKKEK